MHYHVSMRQTMNAANTSVPHPCGQVPGLNVDTHIRFLDKQPGRGRETRMTLPLSDLAPTRRREISRLNREGGIWTAASISKIFFSRIDATQDSRFAVNDKRGSEKGTAWQCQLGRGSLQRAIRASLASKGDRRGIVSSSDDIGVGEKASYMTKGAGGSANFCRRPFHSGQAFKSLSCIAVCIVH